MATQYLWRGGSDLSIAANWTNIATNAPATAPPGPTDSATIGAIGALDVTGTLTVDSLTLAGPLSLAADGAISVGGGTVQAGTVTIGGTGTLTASGLIDSPISVSGTLLAKGGTLGLFGSVSGTGQLAIATDATLFAAGVVRPGLTAAFTGPQGTLELFTTAAAFDASVTGFAPGDVIDIADATITKAVWTGGTLSLLATDGTSLALAVAGNFGTTTFLALPDAFGGSAVTIATVATLPLDAGTLTLAPAPTLYEGTGSAAVAQVDGTAALAGSLQTGSLDLSGRLVVLPSAKLETGTITLAGTLDATGAVSVGSVVAAAGTVAIAADATISGSGRINAALDVAGTLDAIGGALGLFGNVTGSGTLLIGAGATLFAAGAVGAGLTVAFGTDATLILGNPAAFAATLSGVAPGDVLDLAFATAADVPLDQMLHGQYFHTSSDGAGGTLVMIGCFAAGTCIATGAGDAPVETLHPGDSVLAFRDGAWRTERIRWVGRITVDLVRHPQPELVAPIRLRAEAIAAGIPRRDVLLSPDHAVFLDNVLIQARALLNGATVTQEFPARITYLHVELDCHAVLLAENLPAESYLDTGNRALFAGEGGTRPLHPDLVAAAAAWDERACAPLYLGGARLAAAHARLLARAQALGWALTHDPGLEVLADSAPVARDAQGRALLPAGTRSLRLRSRSFVPAWLGLGDDRRRLGVAVASLRLAGRPLPRAAFGSGWHAPEPGWRWTDGEAVLRLPGTRNRARLTLCLADLGARYWQEARVSAASTAGARGIGATAPYPSVFSAAATAA